VPGGVNQTEDLPQKFMPKRSAIDEKKKTKKNWKKRCSPAGLRQGEGGRKRNGAKSHLKPVQRKLDVRAFYIEIRGRGPPKKLNISKMSCEEPNPNRGPIPRETKKNGKNLLYT